MSRFRKALSDLSAAQKPKAGVSLYSRWINRPWGRILAALCYSWGISPNQVTLLSAAASLGGLAFLVFLPPVWFGGILAAFLLALGFALDSADGQVARLAKRGSPAGEWLDHVVDAGKMVLIHAAVLIGAYRYDLLEGAWLLLPLAYLFVAVFFFAALTIFELLSRLNKATLAAKAAPDAVAAPSAPARQASTARAIGLLPADFGILCVTFALWGWQAGFWVVYSLLLIATTLIAVALCAKWFRTLTALGRPAAAS